MIQKNQRSTTPPEAGLNPSHPQSSAPARLHGLAATAAKIAERLGITLKPMTENQYALEQRLQTACGPSADLLIRVGKGTQTVLATPAEIEKIRLSVNRYDAIMQTIMRCAPTAENTLKRLSENEAKAGIQGHCPKTRDQIRDEMIIEITTLKRSLKSATRDTEGLIHDTILPRAQGAVARLIEERTEKELREATDLQIPFKASVYLNSLQRLADALPTSVLCGCGIHPNDQLLGAVKILLREK